MISQAKWYLVGSFRVSRIDTECLAPIQDPQRSVGDAESDATAVAAAAAAAQGGLLSTGEF
jgi:hypothetical protein